MRPLHLERFRASSRATHVFGMLKATTGVNANDWARLSICLSLRQAGVPNPDEYNREGGEFDPIYLFGTDGTMYRLLLISRLRQDGLDPDTYINEMMRAHLNRGAIALKQRISTLFDTYRFADEMNVRRE